jgi:hypothetical protein
MMFFIQTKDKKQNKEKQIKHNLIKNKHAVNIVLDEMVTMGFQESFTNIRIEVDDTMVKQVQMYLFGK